jgi:hypothetical protein
LSKTAETTKNSVAPRWSKLLHISGILAIIMGIIWVAVNFMGMALYRSGLPTTASGFLQLFSQHQALAATTWSLWIVADIILIPITIALYIVLKPVSKSLALGGALFTLAFAIYDPLVSELQSLRLVGYSQDYVAASTVSAKASIIANATPIANALPLMTFISFFLTIGPLLFAIAMTKSCQFRKGTAIFGIATSLMAEIGAFSALGVSSTFVAYCFIICVPAVALWFILVGGQMIRNYRKTAATFPKPAF